MLLFVCAVIARGGLGWGLVKFGAFMGAATGFPLVIVALVLAFVFGFATGSFLLISGRKGRREFIQAGPILTASTMATLIWGPQILVLCSGITRLMPF